MSDVAWVCEASSAGSPSVWTLVSPLAIAVVALGVRDPRLFRRQRARSALPVMASEISPEMQAYYAARAPYYDAVYLKPERAKDIAFLADYLPAALAGRSVIEVACGTGYWTQHIARTAARLVATDATVEPLEFARLRPYTGSVTFRQEDAYNLPSDLGLFDAAFAGLWFSHVPIESRARFIRSLHARLHPGAKVVFIDNSDVQCHELPITETDARGNTYQQRQLRDGTVHRVLKNFPSEAELAQLLLPFASGSRFRMLENFWLLEYELRGQRARL